MTQGYGQGDFGQGTYGQGSESYEPAAAPGPTGPRRARVGLIALIAFLLELIIIAAGANQAVTKHIVSYVDGHNANSFVTSMVRAALVFSWRLTPRHGDTGHAWLSEVVHDVGVLVLTVLLILAIARGPITWGRAFFGIWMTVIVSTCLASIPALLVTKGFAPPGVDKATYAVFSGPDSSEFFAGAALGLVVALITSIVAIATRRPGARLAPAFVPDETAHTAPEPPPPYYGDTAPTQWSQSTSNQPPSNQPASNQPASSARSESPTTAYPVVAPSGPAQSEATTTLPRFDDDRPPGQRSGGPVSEPPSDGSVTSELPKSEAPAADSTSADPTGSGAPRSADDSTTMVPRFTGGETGTWPPQSPSTGLSSPAAPSQGAPAQSAPAQSAPAEPEGGQPTAAFPLPPDDEDLGQHPDHD